jgi:hypothetical protein
VTPALTTPQIAGVAVAGTAVAALGIVSLILFVCVRRRRRATREGNYLPFQAEPSDRHQYGFRGPTENNRGPEGLGGTPDSVVAKVPPRVPPRIATQSPNMFSRRSIRPDTIRLAISPETKHSNDPIERRHSSKLLPEKPTLTLMVPQQAAGQPAQAFVFPKPPSNPPNLRRESTATQFEEDIESAGAAGNADGRTSTDPILENSRGNWTSNPAMDPNLVPPALFVTSSGDSIRRPRLNSNLDLPEYYIKPQNLRAPGSFSQPRRSDTNPRPQQQLQVPSQAARPTTSSSVYSVHASFSPSEPGRSSRLTQNPPSAAYRTRKSYKPSGPYDTRQSASSLTSFDTLESNLSPEPRTVELSPVVESPGRSPVSYPRIPGRLMTSTIRMVPPPPQPDFNKPWRQAELAAAQARSNGSRPMSRNVYEHRTSRPREYVATSAHFNSIQSQQYLQTQPQVQVQQVGRSSSALSGHSTSSSLLAKRRGDQKAAALTLKSEDEVRRQREGKWRVLKEGDIEAAKSPGWRPKAGRRGERGDGGGMEGRERVEWEREELPRTPGWVPRLTPTRRGDELFLSVQ